MNRVLCFVSLCLFLYSGFSCGDPGKTVNLLQNPVFETGTEQPDGWDLFSPVSEGLVFDWEQGVAVSGEHKVSITKTGSGFGMWQQRVEVIGGEEHWVHNIFDVSSLQNPQYTNTALIPHIADPMQWNSFLMIDNIGSQVCNATLSLFDQGELTGLEMITIGPKSRQVIDLREGSWAKLEYTGEDVIVKELFQHKTERGVAEFQLDHLSAMELHFLSPQYSADELSWAGITLLNHHGTQTAMVSLTAIDKFGNLIATNEIEIEPMLRKVGLISDFFDQLDFREVARIHAVSTEELSGIIISGQGNSNLLFTKAVAALTGGTLIMPHIAVNWSTWENLLVFDNLDLTVKDVRVKLLSKGVQVIEEVFHVPGGQNRVINLNDYAHLNPDCGFIEHLPEHLAVRQCYQNKSQGGIAEFLLSDQRSSDLVFTLPATIPNDFNWKGLAICNASSTAGTVSLQAWSDSELLKESTLFLDASSRKAVLCADLFSGIEMNDIANVIARSSFDMSGINISGKDQERLLFTKAHGLTADTSTSPNNSPFGFHPGSSNGYQDIQDLGASWSRQGTYLVWDWVDTERSGGFKFKDATAPPNPDVPNSGGPVNYDAEFMNIPENIMIMRNINPFRKGDEFNNQDEKDTYFDFVKATIERYDGDDDCGCVQAYPDCYRPGDNEYPDQLLLDKLKKNPVKYWQVCNQVYDVCEIDCQNTYAEKYAEVQRLTYLAAKEADPDTQILIAGDSHKEAYPSVYQALGGSYIDIIDFHRFLEEYQYHPKEDLDYLKNALTNAGFDLPSLKFWITETGTYSGDPVPRSMDPGSDLPYQDETQHARGLFKIYISALAHDVEKVFWAWSITEGFKRNGSIFDYTGLIYDGCEWTGNSSDDPNGVYSCNQVDVLYDKGPGEKKLAYYTFKKMVEVLKGSNWAEIEIIQESNGINIYKFTGNETTWVAWNDNHARENISLEVDQGSVIITETIPGFDSGSEVSQYGTAFHMEAQTPINGQININLGSIPVFIESNKGK